MNWIKRLFQKYKKGARANFFPVKDCGLLGGKIRNPKNLDEAIVALDYVIEVGSKAVCLILDEQEFVANFHNNLGRWIRNNWGLWFNSQLAQWFNTYGIWHADDMSGIILTSYYRKTHNLPVNFKEQVRHYIKYWKEQSKEQQ